MNRILPLILLGAALFVSLDKAYAQPTIYIDPDFVLIDSLEQTCLEFKTMDFTDLQEMRFTVRYNPDAVTLVDIPPASLNAGMTGLDIGDFFIDAVEGYVIFTWKVEDIPGCPSSDVTLPDESVLFELCFEGIEGYSEITITDDPEDIYVTRLNSCPLDIGMFIDNGFIAVDNQPLTVNIPYVNANEGETICLDVTVEDFSEIVSFQFSINWLSPVLSFVNVGAYGLPGLSGSNFNVSQVDGWLTCSWYNPDPTQGLTVADGTAIFQICYQVTGNCGQTSPVSVTPDPTPIEIIFEGDEGIDVGVLNGDGAVTVNCFNPNGLSINLPDVSICPGESFCMDVTADNFDDLVGMQFSLNWNPDVIQFTNITNINTSLFTFDIADFNTAGANNGFLTVDWNDPSCFGEVLSDGSVLFTVCFMSVGGGDINTTVAVTSNPMQIEILDQCLGTNLPPNTFNGFVDVCELPGVVLIGQGLTANPGENVCVSIDVQQFEDIEELQFSLIWETSVLDYTGVNNFGLTGLSASNFDVSFIGFGAICLTWTAPGGVGETLPDGTTLFDICFTAIGDPFECSPISFTEFPCLINVVTGESNGTNVGIEPVDGEVCMLNPFNFSVNPTSIDGLQSTTVCVDFEVTNFISLEEVDFSVNWDPAVLLFSSINSTTLTGFNSSSYDDSNVSFGLLSINWSEPVGNGLSLPNGASMFEVCFIVTGDPGECTDISVTGTPQPINVVPDNSGGVNIGLLTVPGEVCSSQFLSMVSALVTGVDCVGDNSGAIDITVTGGSGVYTYNWSGPGIVPPNNTNEDQVNLANGTYYVTIQDNIYGNLTLSDTIEVGFSANAPVADAGEDTSLPCGELSMILDGSGSSQGSQYEYEWQVLTGGFIGSGENTLTPTIVGPGDYQLAVTDLTSGCTIFDTIAIEAASSPGVDITLSSNINCQVDTIQLSGLGSTGGPQYTYLWTTVGGQFVPGNEDSLVTLAVAGGWYYFTVTNTQSGCGTTDSIEVLVDQVLPTAEAGPDTLINCAENTVMLCGTGSSTGSNIAYQWYEPDGSPLSTNLCTPATEGGFYTLVVTNMDNFCQASDSTEVIADTTLPTVVTAISSKINCLADTITLLGEGSSTGVDFSYKWTGPAGGIVPTTDTQLNALATLPGSYALEVTDNGNACKAISVVLVQVDTLPPLAEAGLPSSVTCTVNQAPLNGTGSSTGTPGQFTYLWTANPGSVLSGTETSLMATATSPGLYTLTVTRASNGCTASDTVSVLSNNEAPVASIAPAGTLDCETISVTLDASASTPGLQVTWAGPACINTSPNPYMPVVFCAGTFTITVTNTANGCVSTASVTVVEDTIAPVAVALNTSWDCNDTEVQLDGTGSSQGAIYTYQWTSLGGGAITSGATTLTPTVNGPGAYGLEVKNTQNDCVATDIAQVAADTAAPFVNAGPDSEISCIEPTTTLFGSADPNVTFQWLLNGSPIPGANAATYIASEPGTYTLEATNTINGCVGSDDAIVDPNNAPPLTDAGPDQNLGCEDDSVPLDGSNSASGLTITYQWTALSGLLDPGTVADPIALAQEEGTYVLTVNDQSTGCSGTDTVIVTAVTGLPDATAAFDGDPCELNGFLIGNLPEGTTGVWTVNTSAIIADPTNPDTEISNLASGVNVATWTLSSPNCPNYSSASVSITQAAKPIANNDVGQITEDDVESVEIDLLANDLLLGIANYQVNIVPFAGPGSVEPQNPLDGVVTYFASNLFAGNVEFQYELCNMDCPDLCDTAIVRVLIDKDIDLSESVPNGITPNGDGANETLFFDILEANKDRYPNNSLIIFNRWGDVVFQAAPYNNDWDGTSEDGPLPAGTYYYILRLDIDDSEIVRGDVTIVR